MKCLEVLNWLCDLIELMVPFEFRHHFLQSQFLDLLKHLLCKTVPICTLGKKSLRIDRTPIRFVTFYKVNLRAILFNSALHQSWFPLHTLTQSLKYLFFLLIKSTSDFLKELLYILFVVALLISNLREMFLDLHVLIKQANLDIFYLFKLFI